ncbi:MAG: hypothetical protein LBQ87_01905 [Candidatus Fibromonas sp.]|jgi:hypothetical protein|nr:hypothetical protein [Candidatus Fibromonas sp.]
MKKPVLCAIVIAIAVIACDDKEAKDKQAPATAVPDTSATDTTAASVANTPEADCDTDETVKINYEPSGRIQGIYSANWGYREMERSEIPDTSNLVGLFRENDAYYLKPEKIVFNDNDGKEDNCGGGPVLALMSEAKFLFLNFTDYNKDKIQAISFGKVKVEGGEIEGWKLLLLNEKFTFDFGNVQYEFEALGEVDKERDDWIRNFSLVYSIKGSANKQMIVNIPQAEGVEFRLLFIGDLDGDGKPDIILDAPKNYEHTDIMLFLSSTAKEGEYLRREAHKEAWFDC